MTTKPVRCQFLCEKRQLEFKHDIPSSLVGPAALGNPAMPQMFTTVMRPIVMEHAEASLKACEPKCSSKDCKRDATTVVATPMSVSLHTTMAASVGDGHAQDPPVDGLCSTFTRPRTPS